MQFMPLKKASMFVMLAWPPHGELALVEAGEDVGVGDDGLLLQVTNEPAHYAGEEVYQFEHFEEKKFFQLYTYFR